MKVVLKSMSREHLLEYAAALAGVDVAGLVHDGDPLYAFAQGVAKFVRAETPAPQELERIKTLAEAAEHGGHHIYSHPRDSNEWLHNEVWQRVASPELFIQLLKRMTELAEPNDAQVDEFIAVFHAAANGRGSYRDNIQVALKAALSK